MVFWGFPLFAIIGIEIGIKIGIKNCDVFCDVFGKANKFLFNKYCVRYLFVRCITSCAILYSCAFYIHALFICAQIFEITARFVTSN